MRALKLLHLLKFFNRNHAADYAEFRLNIVCDNTVITTLRKRLFWEMHDLGLRASQVTIGPDSQASQSKLSVVLSCPLARRQDLNDMALRLSQLPEIRRVHWGRRLSAASSQPRALLHPNRAKAA
ncbi:hypothetical protein [Chromobacterium alticapitis]|uniref:ACT domain-containing protein n=1 Tax=Chromobacterium alticapitis TaxID=2073169 RepID=A0A2S5DBZ1_9NEIS|nr:hypothetical protein [Chromobacterium alticapitis]POZ60512.1 hypothetical protein C2I19_18710 [Chromobacterium alticapitis]